MMRLHDVFISSHRKSRRILVTIMGVEKFVSNIYDARHQLLKLTTEKIIAEIPMSYYGPKDLASFKKSSIAELFAGPVQSTKVDLKSDKKVIKRGGGKRLAQPEVASTSDDFLEVNPYLSPPLKLSQPSISSIGLDQIHMKESSSNNFGSQSWIPNVYPQTPIRYNGSLAPGDERQAFQRSMYNRMCSSLLVASQSALNFM